MATGAGDRMDGVVEETRTRSRSPRGDPGAEHAGAPAGTGDTVPEVNLPGPDGGTAVPDLDLPVPEGAAQAESEKIDRTVDSMPQQTARSLVRIISCSRRVLRCS